VRTDYRIEGKRGDASFAGVVRRPIARGFGEVPLRPHPEFPDENYLMSLKLKCTGVK